MKLARTLLIALLWLGGLTPTAITLLVALAMAGRPVPCTRADCLERTYGWELLILPAATAMPLLAGFWIARLSTTGSSRLQAVYSLHLEENEAVQGAGGEPAYPQNVHPLLPRSRGEGDGKI